MRFLLVLLSVLITMPLSAQTGLPPAPYADRQLENPEQEAKARDLMDELRCLKCQSQSIADSNAPMAGDMRSQVRERIAAGETPDQVRNWLVDRYGSWVTYDPPVTAVTWPLWVAPIFLFLAAVWLARGRFRKTKDKE
ncbi:cytochrome c-type biogenesis protein [Parasphingorhabdus sp.]|uniref:cytochrome c-type biogenesis protein n=1 Tax=Parasphingorhabdus sp. TaxID=2709688 RepID=UPI003264311D